MELTQEILKSWLHYDPETGVFTWLCGRRAGRVVGSKRKDGYIHFEVAGTAYLAHRLAFLYVHGRFPKHTTDHINGVKDDNRINNLREATQGENVQNQRFPQDKITNTGKKKSGFIGVWWAKNNRLWCARITLNGKRFNLGYFKKVEDAAAAYIEAKRKLHPFGNL
jgi:hypothetical protein